MECFTNNGVAGVKFREDEEEGWTPVSRRRSRRRKTGPGRTSGDPVDPVTIPDEATAFPSGGWDSFTLRANQLENPELVAHCRNRLKY